MGGIFSKWPECSGGDYDLFNDYCGNYCGFGSGDFPERNGNNAVSIWGKSGVWKSAIGVA